MILLLALMLAQDCLDCHKRQEEEHKPSVHMKHGISCKECHGTDTLDPMNTRNPHKHAETFDPGRPDVLKLCVTCHQVEVDEFRESKHLGIRPPPDSDLGKMLKKKKDCLLCHQHHATETATFPAIAGRCAACHGDKDPQVAAMERLLTSTERLVQDLPSRLKQYRAAGRVSVAAEDVRAMFAQMRRKQHAAKLPPLEAMRQEAVGRLEQEEVAVRRRPLWLAGFLVLMAIFTGSLVRTWRNKYQG